MFELKFINSKISISLVVSLIIHLFIGLYFVTSKKTGKIYFANQEVSQKKIDLMKFGNVKVISRKQLEQIKKQIVATSQNGNKIKPKNSRFSGMTDQEFDRQTIAKSIGAFKEAGAGESKSIAKSEAKNDKPQAKKKKEILSLSNLGFSGLERFEKTEPEVKSATPEVKSGVSSGNPNFEGIASNNDFVEDIPLGDVTNINTTENKYYGFYHRIKQKLEQSWGSSIQARATKLYKSGRRIPASGNLITAITVILNDKGNILDIKIDGSSGIRELDQAAIESFNKAGPFPNPPKGLLVDGRAVIQWGFVVKS